MSIDVRDKKGKPPGLLIAALPIDTVVTVGDSREQLSYILPGLQVIERTLQAGDYSSCGLEGCIAIECKSPSDLVTYCGIARERLERELSDDRMTAEGHARSLYLAARRQFSELQSLLQADGREASEVSI